MSNVKTFERFVDAVDRRAAQINYEGYDYKAGFFESFLEALSQTYPQVDGAMVAAAQMLEKWADEEEQRNRVAEVDVTM